MVNFYDKFVVCPPNNKPTTELTDVAGFNLQLPTIYSIEAWFVYNIPRPKTLKDKFVFPEMNF